MIENFITSLSKISKYFASLKKSEAMEKQLIDLF